MKNRSKIKIICRNQEKIINKITKIVPIYNFVRKEDKCSEFEVDLKNKKKIQNFLKENNIEILSLKDNGLLHKIKRIIFSVGAICGILLASVVYSIQYFFVWKINVFGFEKAQEVQVFIDENLTSRLKNKIDVKKLEMMVKHNFKEVSSISIAIVGQSLLVNINEAVLPQEMGGQFAPIISCENAQITDIKLIQGTLNCKIGDIVQKGDILVYPYVVDSQGEKRDVKPEAEIFADVWISETTIHYDYSLQKERTGEKIVLSEVLLFDKVVYENKKDINFTEYEIEENEEFLTKNLLLPLKIRKKICYETTIFEVSQPFDEYKDEIIENTRLKALQFLEKNEIIKKENCSVKEGPACSKVTYTITVNRNLGG